MPKLVAKQVPHWSSVGNGQDCGLHFVLIANLAGSFVTETVLTQASNWSWLRLARPVTRILADEMSFSRSEIHEMEMIYAKVLILIVAVDGGPYLYSRCLRKRKAGRGSAG